MEISEIKSNLILTFDYELFGDGSGDIFIHIIEPTNKILRICDDYGIKATIFFEAIEFIKLKEEWNKGNSMGYSINPITAIENQIRNAVKNGHDIQLHVHPQWVNAKYSNNKWELDFKNWRLGDFKSTGSYTIKNLLQDGKKELENLIFPVFPEYKCIALRAGGYNIMPSSEVYLAMKELGLKIDSSIYPGGFENDSFSKFDYRNVPLHLDYWWANEMDFRQSTNNKSAVIEIPVFALPLTRWKKVLTYSKIRSFFLDKNVSMSFVAKEKIKKKSFIEKMKFMLQKESYTWDVCMFSETLNKHFFKYIEENLEGSRNTFVLIGHPKSLQDERVFKSFLEITQSKNNTYTFKLLCEQYAEIR